MKKIKPETKRRLRNIGLVLGGFGAIGVGCYFGTKKGFTELGKTLQNIDQATRTTAMETANIYDLLEGEMNSRVHMMWLIDLAKENGVPFKHYPGIGLKFNSLNDLQKVEKMVEKAITTKR